MRCDVERAKPVVSRRNGSGPNFDHLPDLVAGRLAKSVGRGRDQAAATDGTWGG